MGFAQFMYPITNEKFITVVGQMAIDWPEEQGLRSQISEKCLHMLLAKAGPGIFWACYLGLPPHELESVKRRRV